MTIEELRDYVDFLRSQDEISYDIYSGLIDGIDTLEQEPFKPMVEIDLDYVIKQKYIERDVLDKIRAEIKQMDFDFGDFYDHTSTIREMVLEVIDKAESELQKSEDT